MLLEFVLSITVLAGGVVVARHYLRTKDMDRIGDTIERVIAERSRSDEPVAIQIELDTYREHE